jgi:hypothetical protein
MKVSVVEDDGLGFGCSRMLRRDGFGAVVGHTFTTLLQWGLNCNSKVSGYPNPAAATPQHMRCVLCACLPANPDAMETDEAAEDDGADFLLTDTGDDVDLRLARLEALAGRRAALLSAVMLRQNPHNVAEWHKRVKLFAGDPTKQVR